MFNGAKLLLALLLEGHLWNIRVKLFPNLSSFFEKEVIQTFCFLF